MKTEEMRVPNIPDTITLIETHLKHAIEAGAPSAENYRQCLKALREMQAREDLQPLTLELVTTTVGSLTPKSVFAYGGVNWVVLQQVDSGALCLAAEILFDEVFDDDNRNNWELSSLRKYLNNDFLKELIQSGAAEAAFVPMAVDLTADDGLKDYGTCEDLISLITCQQCRHYRDVIPNADNYWWTCTAYSTKANGFPDGALGVSSRGTLSTNSSCDGHDGVRPLCTLKSDTLVSVISEV